MGLMESDVGYVAPKRLKSLFVIIIYHTQYYQISNIHHSGTTAADVSSNMVRIFTINSTSKCVWQLEPPSLSMSNSSPFSCHCMQMCGQLQSIVTYCCGRVRQQRGAGVHQQDHIHHSLLLMSNALLPSIIIHLVWLAENHATQIRF